MFAAVIDLQEAHPIISLNPNEMTRSDLAQTLTSTFCHTSHAVSPLSHGDGNYHPLLCCLPPLPHRCVQHKPKGAVCRFFWLAATLFPLCFSFWTMISLRSLETPHLQKSLERFVIRCTNISSPVYSMTTW